jgi:putative SOS response-associated peptidase YedK
MCGRYALHAHADVVALQFGLAEPPQFKASYNVCPASEILIVTNERHGERVARQELWGQKLANARAETVSEKPAFRDAFLRRRCLVPASGFYEWQTRGAQKQPWYLRPADAALFGLAGIVTLRNGMRSVALITTAPNELMRPIHDRMPVIVPLERYTDWLERANDDVALLLAPYPAQRMTAHPVSARVNRPENDDHSLIEACLPAQRDLL